MKKNILFMIIGLVLGISITAFAGSYSAKDVTFTPSDSNWKVSNVSDAMNDLKKSKKTKIIKIGDYTSQVSNSIDIKSILPEDYQNLTIDNFVVKEVKVGWRNGYDSDHRDYLINSYDNTTGILLLNRADNGDGAVTMYMEYSIYCIIGNIE